MIAISVLVGVVLAVGLIGALSRTGSRPALDNEAGLHAASELHRIKRRLDVDALKSEIRQNARDTERRGLRELDDGP